MPQPRGKHRETTLHAVRVNYNKERTWSPDQINALTWEGMVLGVSSSPDFALMGDRVVRTTPERPREALLERMEKAVMSYVPSGGTVVEFGSGSGRNIFYLKHRFPDRNFIGLELSPVSVDLSTLLAAKFGIDARFLTCNIADPLPPEHTSWGAHMAYSSHVLEQMPRIFPAALHNMATVAKKAVVLFEPIPEVWPMDRRGLASRLRTYNLDRLRHVMPHIKVLSASGWNTTYVRRLGTADNPLNETVELHLVRTPPERAVG